MAYTRIRKRKVERTVDLTDGNRKVVVEWRYYPSIMFEGRELGLGSCRTREDSVAAVNHAQSRVAQGKHPKKDRDHPETVDDLWQDTLESNVKTRNWRDSTASNNLSAYRVHIEPEFGKRDISGISSSDIQQWINEMCDKQNRQGEPLASGTIDFPYRLLRQLLIRAEDNGDIVKSPCKKIIRPSLKDVEIDFLPHDEIERALYLMEPKHLVYFSILLYAGLRAGEGLALKRKNIDLDNKKINVTHSWSVANGYDKPKTRAARRYVPMVDVLYERLREYCESNELEPDDFLFKSSRTDLPVQAPYRKQFNRALKAAGLRHISVNSLRHSFASFMIASGASIMALSKAMGHTSTQLTLDTYGHLYPQDLENSIDKANAYLSRSCEKENEDDSPGN